MAFGDRRGPSRCEVRNVRQAFPIERIGHARGIAEEDGAPVVDPRRRRQRQPPRTPRQHRAVKAMPPLPVRQQCGVEVVSGERADADVKPSARHREGPGVAGRHVVQDLDLEGLRPGRLLADHLHQGYAPGHRAARPRQPDGMRAMGEDEAPAGKVPVAAADADPADLMLGIMPEKAACDKLDPRRQGLGKERPIQFAAVDHGIAAGKAPASPVPRHGHAPDRKMRHLDAKIAEGCQRQAAAAFQPCARGNPVDQRHPAVGGEMAGQQAARERRPDNVPVNRPGHGASPWSGRRGWA